MSSDGTKRRRIRETLDSILYVTKIPLDTPHKYYVENSIASISLQNKNASIIPLPISPVVYSTRTKK